MVKLGFIKDTYLIFGWEVKPTTPGFSYGRIRSRKIEPEMCLHPRPSTTTGPQGPLKNILLFNV